MTRGRPTPPAPLTMVMALPTVEEAEKTRKFIKDAGGNGTWDRLAEYLDQELHGKERFVINRSFDAPVARVWEAWTDPRQFMQWLPPTGMTMKFERADLRPGGSTFYVMTNGKDVAMYGRIHYLSFERPHRLTYTQEFCDANEKISRHPFAPTWPAQMLTVVTLTEEGPDQTRVTVQWEPHGDFTSEELKTFIAARPGMTQGWTGSFDKLEAHLDLS